MTTEQTTYLQTKKWTTIGIIISWATFWIFLLSPFGLLAWIGIFIYLIIKKSRLKWYLILSAWLFVPSCNFLTGTVYYFTGTASIKGVGGPQTYHGIDRITRATSTSSGCIFVGFEPFVFPANNLAVTLWTNLFGYQTGAYSGVFPTEDEAKEIIKTADTLNVKQTDKYYQFAAVDKVVKVDTLEFRKFHYSSNSFDRVVGKIINNECFLFQRVDTKNYEYRKPIYLVDINKNKILTQYFVYQ